MYNLYHEQEMLEGMFKYDMMGIKDKIMILEPDVFNSNPETVCHFKKGWDKTFVIHLMALPYKTRSKIMSEYIQNNLTVK